MTPFLVLVLAVFGTFMAVLGFVSIWSNLKPVTRTRAVASNQSRKAVGAGMSTGGSLR